MIVFVCEYNCSLRSDVMFGGVGGVVCASELMHASVVMFGDGVISPKRNANTAQTDRFFNKRVLYLYCCRCIVFSGG